MLNNNRYLLLQVEDIEDLPRWTNLSDDILVHLFECNAEIAIDLPWLGFGDEYDELTRAKPALHGPLEQRHVGLATSLGVVEQCERWMALQSLACTDSTFAAAWRRARSAYEQQLRGTALCGHKIPAFSSHSMHVIFSGRCLRHSSMFKDRRPNPEAHLCKPCSRDEFYTKLYIDSDGYGHVHSEDAEDRDRYLSSLDSLSLDASGISGRRSFCSS